MLEEPAIGGGQTLEVDPEHVVQYAHYGYVYCLLLTGKLSQDFPGEDILISGGGDGTIKLWALDEAEDSKIAIAQIACLENGDYSVVSMVLDGTLLYAGLLEGDINVWDLETRQLVRNVKAHSEDVLTLAVAGEFLLSGAASGTVKVRSACALCCGKTWLTFLLGIEPDE
jgi:di- and tripeptidase